MVHCVDTPLPRQFAHVFPPRETLQEPVVINIEKTYKRRIRDRIDRHPFNGLFFEDNLDKPAPVTLNNLDFNETRDDGMAVASAGP